MIDQIDATRLHTLQTANPELNNGRWEVVFIEDNVADYQTLIDGLKAGVEVVLLDASKDGLSAMAEWAQSHSGYDAIHVISHGAEGRIDLGELSLDTTAAINRSADLATLGAALNEDGDLLLYGCSVATGDGESFISVLAAHTGADVAASDNLTSAAALGGDWLLERRLGSIESVGVSSALFGGVLAPVMTLDSGALAYTENAAATAISAAATIIETVSPGSSVLKVQISANAEAADTLSLPTGISSGINISGYLL
jgi:hypothetical protein